MKLATVRSGGAPENVAVVVVDDGRGVLFHRFEDIIAFVSRSEIVHPGEILGSGTVGGGCGLELGRFLNPGDVVQLEIEGIGVLRNRIIKET